MSIKSETVMKIFGAGLSVAGAVIGIASGYVSNRMMKNEIAKEVSEQLSKRK